MYGSHVLCWDLLRALALICYMPALMIRVEGNFFYGNFAFVNARMHTDFPIDNIIIVNVSNQIELDWTNSRKYVVIGCYHKHCMHVTSIA